MKTLDQTKGNFSRREEKCENLTTCSDRKKNFIHDGHTHISDNASQSQLKYYILGVWLDNAVCIYLHFVYQKQGLFFNHVLRNLQK